MAASSTRSKTAAKKTAKKAASKAVSKSAAKRSSVAKPAAKKATKATTAKATAKATSKASTKKVAKATTAKATAKKATAKKVTKATAATPAKKAAKAAAKPVAKVTKAAKAPAAKPVKAAKPVATKAAKPAVTKAVTKAVPKAAAKPAAAKPAKPPAAPKPAKPVAAKPAKPAKPAAPKSTVHEDNELDIVHTEPEVIEHNAIDVADVVRAESSTAAAPRKKSVLEVAEEDEEFEDEAPLPTVGDLDGLLGRLRQVAEHGGENLDDLPRLLEQLEQLDNPSVMPTLLGLLEDNDPYEIYWNVLYVLERFDDAYLQALLDGVEALYARAPQWAYTCIIRILNTRGDEDDCTAAFERLVNESSSDTQVLVTKILRELSADPDTDADQKQNIARTISAIGGNASAEAPATPDVVAEPAAAADNSEPPAVEPVTEVSAVEVSGAAPTEPVAEPVAEPTPTPVVAESVVAESTPEPVVAESVVAESVVAEPTPVASEPVATELAAEPVATEPEPVATKPEPEQPVVAAPEPTDSTDDATTETKAAD